MNNNRLPPLAIWHANVDTSHGRYCKCKGLKENHFINHLEQNIETNVSIRHGLRSVITKSMTFCFIIQGYHFTNEWNNRSVVPSSRHNLDTSIILTVRRISGTVRINLRSFSDVVTRKISVLGRVFGHRGAGWESISSGILTLIFR